MAYLSCTHFAFAAISTKSMTTTKSPVGQRDTFSYYHMLTVRRVVGMTARERNWFDVTVAGG
jgi:ribosomal protein S10